METKGKPYYFIREAAEWTGLTEQIIRKWENRYQIIEPKRLDNGYRVYTHDDLLTLKLLKAYRDEGKSMKQAIELLDRQHSGAGLFQPSHAVERSPYVAQLIESGAVYDEDQLLLLLRKANHEYGLDLFLQNTVQPFLHQIGVLWESGAWDESQETVSSLVVKDFLTLITRNFNNGPDARHALGFCLPNERHEIPLQIILLRLKMRGWRTTMIGASPKYTSIETLVKQLQPQAVLFSATTTIPFQEDEQLLTNLDQLAMKYNHIAFHIGGRGAWEYTRIFEPKYIHVSGTVEDLSDKNQ